MIKRQKNSKKEITRRAAGLLANFSPVEIFLEFGVLGFGAFSE
jgi:hypothetical protein